MKDAPKILAIPAGLDQAALVTAINDRLRRLESTGGAQTPAATVAGASSPGASDAPPLLPTAVAVAEHAGERRSKTGTRVVETPVYVDVTLPANHGAQWLTVWFSDGTDKTEMGRWGIGAEVKFWVDVPLEGLPNCTVSVTTGKPRADNPPSAAVSSAPFTIAGYGATPPAPINGITLSIGASSYDYSPATDARSRYLQLHATFSVTSGSMEGVSVYWKKTGDTGWSYDRDYQYTASPDTIDVLGLTPPTAATTYRLVLCPFANGLTTAPDDGTYVDIAVGTVPNPNAGQEKAGLVTQYSGQPYVSVDSYFYDSNGNYKARLKVQFVAPADARWSGVDLVKMAYDAARTGRLYADQPLGTFTKSPGTVDVAAPSVEESWDCALLSFNGDGERNTYQSGVTPQNTIAIGSASGTFDITRYDPSKTVMFDIDSNGRLIVKPGAALDIDPSTGLLRVKVGGVTNDLFDRTSAQKLVIVNGDLAANSVLANNIVSGSVSSRHLDATEVLVGGGGEKPGRFGVYGANGAEVGFVGVNGLSTGYVNSAALSQNGSFYYSAVTYVSGQQFRPEMVAALITIGGYQAQISQVTSPTSAVVVNTTGYIVATNAAYSSAGAEGAWFKTLSVAGTNYYSGKMQVDSYGNLNILDGTLMLTRTESDGETYVAQINSAFTADYGTHTFTGLQVYRNTAGSHRALLINRGVVCYNPNAYRVAAVTSYNGDSSGGNAGAFYGDIWVADSTGTIQAELSGATGQCMARGGFMVWADNQLWTFAQFRSGWTGFLSTSILGARWVVATRSYNTDVQGVGYVYVDGGIITEVRTTQR